MRKILTLMILISAMGLFATLNIDIPFDTAVVAETSEDAYTSAYFQITNVGAAADYTIDIEMLDYPDGWFMTWCNGDLIEGNIFEGCHHHTQPYTFSFPADSTLDVDFQVNNMGGAEGMITFEYVITGGDLAEPMILPFTFTAQNEVVNPQPLLVDIEWDTNVVGDTSDEAYTSAYFQITNVSAAADYTIDIEMIDYPDGWFMTWCNGDLVEGNIFEGCHHHTQPFTFSFPANSTLDVDFQVNNMGGAEGMITFEYVITGGELTEAIILPFTFRTTNYVSNDNSVVAPNMVALTNYPNPFNPETTISFNLNKASQVELVVFNILGQRVKTLVNEYQTSGNHTVVWNGTDEAGNNLSSGIYFYKLTNGTQITTNKMILMK